MMIPNQAIDIYAHLNPAFGALVFHDFTKGFMAGTHQSGPTAGPTFPHYFLALPVLYSRKGRNSFQGTNKTTGFWNWLERHPEIRIGFADEVRAGKPITHKVLVFSVAYHLLDTDGWHYWTVEKPPWRSPGWKSRTDERGEMLSNARSLGTWMAKIGLVDIFLALGVRP
ncbi:MAG: hypothetical protein KJO08_10030 [Gammaproteobacteria bacterium]|nr:hypothetical protein [Gammaproteobacteria bacterium]